MDVSRDNLVQNAGTEEVSGQSKTLLGRLFESLVALSLKTYVLANEARLRHFRSSNGAREVDFIVEKGSSLIAIEVKLSNTVDKRAINTLNWFGEEFSGYRVAKCLVNTGSHAYTRSDGIHVIPASLLQA
jgi:predicted AAA+ superfamily ATPase